MEIRVRAKIWLEIEDDGVPFCHGKAALLAAIRAHGSIRQAARALRMSYRRAWQYVREIERGMQFTVVSTQVGGVRGGGTVLTAQGAELLAYYEKTLSAVSQAVNPQGVETV